MYLSATKMSDDDYGFEYSDDDGQEEEDVNIENQYYNSKGLLDSDVDAALSGFGDVISMEEEKGEWGFKVCAGTVDVVKCGARPLHAAWVQLVTVGHVVSALFTGSCASWCSHLALGLGGEHARLSVRRRLLNALLTVCARHTSKW